MIGKKSRDLIRILLVLTNAHTKRLDTAQNKPTIECTCRCAESIGEILEALAKLRCLGDNCATDTIAMSIQPFCCRMYNDIGAEIKWFEKCGREKCIIYTHKKVIMMRNVGKRFHIIDTKERITRRFDP